MGSHRQSFPTRGLVTGVALLTGLFGPADRAGAQRQADGVATPVAARPAAEHSTAADLDALRGELASLRDQVQALAAEVRTLRQSSAAAVAPGPAVPEPPAVQLPAATLQAQLRELAQVKVESASRFPVTLAGTIVSNTAYNSGDANWLESPNLVGTASGGSFTSTMRQSRLGLDVDGIPVGAWRATGALVVDFFGGTPGFVTGTVMGLPRLLDAFGRLERGGTALQAGQDQVLLAPRDPTSLASLAFPQFFRAGNLYLRAPQMRVEQRFGNGFGVKAGLVAPVAGDAGPDFAFATTAGGGERSERPAFEGRGGYDSGTPESASEAHLGVSGHLGWIRQAGALVEASAGALDFHVRRGRVGLAGELFAADELDAFGAGGAQPGRAAGGWVEARVAAFDRVSITGGAGLDRRPDGVGAAGRLRNGSAFGNVILQLSPEVAASVEYKWLQTRYGSGSDRANHHVNAVFAVKF